MADNALTIKQKSTLPVGETRQDKPLFRSLSGAYLPPQTSCACVVGRGSIGLLSNNAPSDRQLMSIGASEHRAFVRAKARFAGQKAQEHILSVEMPFLPDIFAMYRWRHFRQSRSSRRHRTASGSSLRLVAARCEPFSAFPLLPGPLTCTTAASVTGATSRCEPFSAFPLLPRPSTCPAWSSAAPVAARCEPFSENRLTPASRDSGSRPSPVTSPDNHQPQPPAATASCPPASNRRRRTQPSAVRRP